MKRPRRFFWKLFLGNALLLIAVVATCLWQIFGVFDLFYNRELSTTLRGYAELLRYEVTNKFDRAHAAELDRLTKTMAAELPEGMRITLVLLDGTVLADSEADPARMESHAGRPEIREALESAWGDSVRWSRTVGREMSYVARRIGPQEAPLGVVRVSMAVRSIVARLQSARQLFLKIGFVIVAAAVVLALGLAWLWSGPIARLTATARSLSKGDLSARAPTTGRDEVALLARSLNRMRDNIARQLDTIDRQRRTLEHLLAKLHEGVVVAGPDGRIILLNPAAARLLDIIPTSGMVDGHPFQGVHVERCIPHLELRRMLIPRRDEDGGDQAASASGVFDGESSLDPTIDENRLTVIRRNTSVTLLARASDIALLSADGQAEENGDGADQPDEPTATGRLLVLTDITELQRAIQVKTDFVANASHELRTPLTAIRAAIETLSTVDLADEMAAAQSLMGVIDRQSARLGAMVADLLDLSRLESGSTDLTPAPVFVPDLLRELHERFTDRLIEKRLQWNTTVSPECEEIEVNRQLLTLVLDNLVDNALKFTEPGGFIHVDVERVGDRVRLSVEDNGCGIPREDHARVFERFYQVERARTGPGRGTGLGLSIVRHAVVAMEGSIELDSVPGEGTRISIQVPQPAESVA